MNILFTICGRAGSQQIRNKNVLDFCEHPLPYYALSLIRLFQKAHAEEYGHIDIVLSTDSARLKELVSKSAGDAYIVDREQRLAGSQVRKIEVIRDAAKRAEQYFAREYAIVVDLDITSPLRRLSDLEAVIKKRKDAGADVDVVFTVTEARRSPYFNMVTNNGRYYDRVIHSTFATRQESPALYDMNGSIYAYIREFIYNENELFSRGDIVVMEDTGILDIDDCRDYELMQVIGRYLFETDEELSRVYEAAADCGRGYISDQHGAEP